MFNRYILSLFLNIIVLNCDIRNEESVTMHLVSVEHANHILQNLGVALAKAAAKNTHERNAKTISEKDIITAISIYSEGLLRNNCIEQGQKALDKNREMEGTTPQKRSGILFPLSISHRLLKNNDFQNSLRVSANASIYLAAILEYICMEILDVSNDIRTNESVNELCPHHLKLGIESDPELSLLTTKIGVYIIHAPRHGFLSRAVRSRLENERSGKGVVKLLTKLLASMAFDLFRKARELSIHAGRNSVRGTDLLLANKLTPPIRIDFNEIVDEE